MKTTGEILKSARLKQELSLSQIAKRTKINEQFLASIEENNFEKLPAAAFTKGFMRQYAKAVGLDPNHVLAVFRRDYDQDARGRVIPRGLVNPIKAASRVFNPATTATIIAAIVSLLIVGFFTKQIIDFVSAPTIQVVEPAQEAQVNSPVTVRGITDPEATVIINQAPAIVQEDGSFSATIELSNGEHIIVIEATSRSNKKAIMQHRFEVVGQQSLP
jgi:cytoskeletal protein RodZ